MFSAAFIRAIGHERIIWADLLQEGKPKTYC